MRSVSLGPKPKHLNRLVTPPEIEVFYDGGCPICQWEVSLYSRIDKQRNIAWVEIGRLSEEALPKGKTQEDLLGKFHVREIGCVVGEWFIGVDAFARIWRALPGFRYFAFLFKVPVLRQIANLAYLVFLRWQQGHRSKRQ